MDWKKKKTQNKTKLFYIPILTFAEVINHNILFQKSWNFGLSLIVNNLKLVYFASFSCHDISSARIDVKYQYLWGRPLHSPTPHCHQCHQCSHKLSMNHKVQWFFYIVCLEPSACQLSSYTFSSACLSPLLLASPNYPFPFCGFFFLPYFKCLCSFEALAPTLTACFWLGTITCT